MVAALTLWSCSTAGSDVQTGLPAYEAASGITETSTATAQGDVTPELASDAAAEGTVPLPSAKPGEDSAALVVPAPTAGDQPANVDQAEATPAPAVAAAATEPAGDAVAEAASTGVDPATAGDGSVATAAPAEAAPAPKKPSLFAFFGSSKPRNPVTSSRDGGGAPAAATPVKRAAITAAPQQVATAATTNDAPLPQLKMAALDLPSENPMVASRSGQASDDGGLPGVRQSALFEIKRRSGMDDDSDVDIYEDAPPVQLASAGGMARMSPNGLLTQHESVDVACLKPALVRMLKQIESRYGRKLVVTSGYRSPSHNRRARGAKNSQHMYCAAADIQVPGVGKAELARYVRAMPNRGGVGTYCHTNSIHVDVGPNRDWNWRCRGRRKG